MRTERETDYEEKLKKKVRTSGCAQGTVFGDLMEKFEEVALPGDARLRTSWLYALSRKINGGAQPLPRAPARSTAACSARATGRWSTWRTSGGTTRSTRSPATCSATASTPEDKIFYTTGRLTSEMVIKTVQMGIPILVSRSGFTAWGVELARQAGLTLVGRAKGKRFIALAGEERIVFGSSMIPGPRRRRGGRPPPAQGRRDDDDRITWRFRCRRPLGGRPVPAHGRRRQVPAGPWPGLGSWPISSSRVRAAGRRPCCSTPTAIRPALPRPSACRSRPTWSKGFAGPLAGVLTGLDWAAERHVPELHASLASASPAMRPSCPCDLVARLLAAVDGLAGGGPGLRHLERRGRHHPVFGLWPLGAQGTTWRRAMAEEQACARSMPGPRRHRLVDGRVHRS